MAKNDESKGLIAFIGFYETQSKDGYIGSALVTDWNGVPQEFRCTHPVKPSAIQRSLYGSALELHIGVDLCGIPLLMALQKKPALVIVDKGVLLGIRKSSDRTVVSLSSNGKNDDSGTSSVKPPGKKGEKLTCPNGRYPDIIISVHGNYDDDMQEARDILSSVYCLMDLAEPFQRMETAIGVLGKQDKTFS